MAVALKKGTSKGPIGKRKSEENHGTQGRKTFLSQTHVAQKCVLFGVTEARTLKDYLAAFDVHISLSPWAMMNSSGPNRSAAY